MHTIHTLRLPRHHGILNGMQPDYWLKQDGEPFFPDLLWSRPEMKHAAGKLLIIGGNAHSFAAPAAGYTTAEKAGIGIARVMLPDSLAKTVKKVFPEAEYAPSNPSGGFSAAALAEMLDAAHWADGVLLAGDFGRNSESLAMLENFAGKYSGQLTITKDAADFFCAQPQSVTARPHTLLVASLGQLQKLGVNLHLPYAFTSETGLLQLVEQLHGFSATYPACAVITRHGSHTIVATGGRISTTPADPNQHIWQTTTAAAAATWWLQNLTRPFEALTTSLTGS